jgi:geranylgeranyl diphosphate synthase type II
MNSELRGFFEAVCPAVESSLDGLIPAKTTNPSRIHEAMRYSTLGSGKRVRPCLCAAAYSVWHEDWRPIIPVASAIEMIHAYSLIHDDLPAMDDDDFRRGKPSCHKQFGEAMAILAGDALLTLAFEVMARCEGFPADRLLKATATLAHAAGTPAGMVAGQVLDLAFEGVPITPEQLERIHRFKTGALISASVWIGAYLGNASDRELENIAAFCGRIGLAFQVIDDILDATDGSNRDEGKATYPTIHGLEKSRALAHDLMKGARQAIAPLGPRSRLLVEFCDFLENRTN